MSEHEKRFSGPSILGQRYCIDTNVFIDRGAVPRVDELFELAASRWVTRVKTDTVDVERAVGDEALVARRLAETAGIVELLGPHVLGHARLDHVVVADDADVASIDALWTALLPRTDRATARKNHLRDVMHINTARRYGCDAGDRARTGAICR